MIKEKIIARAAIDSIEILSLSIIYSDLTGDFFTKLDLGIKLANLIGVLYCSREFRVFLDTMENRHKPEIKQSIRDVEKSEANRYVTEGVKYSVKDIRDALVVIIRARICSHQLRKEIQKIRNAA